MLTLWNYAEAWTPHQVRGDGLWLGKFCFSLLTLRHSGLRPGVSAELPICSDASTATEIPGQARNDAGNGCTAIPKITVILAQASIHTEVEVCWVCPCVKCLMDSGRHAFACKARCQNDE